MPLPRPLLVVLALALSGCTFAAPAGEPESPLALPLEDATASAPFDPLVLARRAVALTVEERWIRPSDLVRASARSEGATSIEWFLENENPIHHDAVPARSFPVEPGALATFPLADPGRHLLVAEGARLNVTVTRDLAPSALYVVLSEREGAWSFAPHDALVGAGTRLVVEDRAPRGVVVTRTDVLRAVGAGPDVAFRMPTGFEQGDYDLVVVARDGTSVGEASARLVYDSRKPDANWTAGPWSGRFDVGPQAGPVEIPWRAGFASRDVRVAIQVSSPSPLPAAVLVRIVDDGGAEVAAGAAPGFDLAELPRGNYTFVIAAQEGLFVDYAVEATGVWLLEAPSSFFRS